MHVSHAATVSAADRDVVSVSLQHRGRTTLKTIVHITPSVSVGLDNKDELLKGDGLSVCELWPLVYVLPCFSFI